MSLVRLVPIVNGQVHFALVVAEALLRHVVLVAVQQHLVVVLHPVVNGPRVGLHVTREGDVRAGRDAVQLAGHAHLWFNYK